MAQFYFNVSGTAKGSLGRPDRQYDGHGTVEADSAADAQTQVEASETKRGHTVREIHVWPAT